MVGAHGFLGSVSAFLGLGVLSPVLKVYISPSTVFLSALLSQISFVKPDWYDYRLRTVTEEHTPLFPLA